MNYIKVKTSVELATGKLTGANVSVTDKTMAQMGAVFADQEAAKALPGDTVICHIECHTAVAEGTPGGLFFATSFVQPGRVGDEFFMTKGHFHEKREAAEYYWGISGSGLLLKMAEDGVCAAEEVKEGSLHYIAGNVAHRLVNTGSTPLAVGACWPSDAGHNYAEILQKGFPVRVVCREGKVCLIENKAEV